VRALVTGGAGFIGGYVVTALVSEGARVRAFDRSPPAAGTLPDTVEFVRGDILDADAVRRAVDKCDAVFHLAAVYSFARRDAALMRAVNVRGTRVVLDAALRGKRRRVVHTSSCATCGPVRGRPATEHDRPPRRELAVPYKRTKVEGEGLALRAAREGAEVIVVNPTAPVGSGDLRPTPTGKMVADVARGRARGYLARSALNVVGVEDVARGHLAAFERGRAGERYLLGGDNLSVRELFAVIADVAGLRAPRLAVPWIAAYAGAGLVGATLRPLGREPELLVFDEIRAGRLPHRFDDAKARAELGYASRPVADALAEAARCALSRDDYAPRSGPRRTTVPLLLSRSGSRGR
jgi:dihydroflavonol-4-reductase